MKKIFSRRSLLRQNTLRPDRRQMTEIKMEKGLCEPVFSQSPLIFQPVHLDKRNHLLIHRLSRGIVGKPAFGKNENMTVIIHVCHFHGFADFYQFILLAIFQWVRENLDKHRLLAIPVDSVESILEIAFLVFQRHWRTVVRKSFQCMFALT